MLNGRNTIVSQSSYDKLFINVIAGVEKRVDMIARIDVYIRWTGKHAVYFSPCRLIDKKSVITSNDFARKIIESSQVVTACYKYGIDSFVFLC